MKPFPRITFGMIVLNSEPFVRYNLRALYPFAHEIIVVEGAVRGAEGIATPDGHSRDSTLETLRRFKAEEDPDDKLQIITRAGFWAEKDEMSQAYAQRATGDYLWQVDADEFYLPDAMQQVIDLLREDPQITAMSFKNVIFWGAPQYRVDSWYLRRGEDIFHRLFKWGPAYQYASHRPPTVIDSQGRDLRSLKWIDGAEMTRRGVILYHYSLLLPKQVIEKCDYYAHASWATHAREAIYWAQNHYLRLGHPFRVYNVYQYPGWLERFDQEHPPQAMAMWQAVLSGELGIEARQNEDVERLLRSFYYRAARPFVKYADLPARPKIIRRFYRLWQKIRWKIKSLQKPSDKS